MLARLANVIGWACNGVAALLVLLLVAGLMFGDLAGHWPTIVFVVVLAAGAWTFGKAIRYIVGGTI